MFPWVLFWSDTSCIVFYTSIGENSLPAEFLWSSFVTYSREYDKEAREMVTAEAGEPQKHWHVQD